MIAIHIYEKGYSNRWIQYCERNKLAYLPVDIFESDIISRLKENGVSLLLCNLGLTDHRNALISKEILMSIQKAGIRVFPDHESYWHHDNKVAQKYMFESLQIPHPKSWVFYSKDEAKKWLASASYPLVFKLSSGSSSNNVVMLRNPEQAAEYVRRMFGKGIKPSRSVLSDYRNRLKVHSRKRDLRATIKRLPQTILGIRTVNTRKSREKGYFLVQEFIPGNHYDTRVFVIGDRAFALRRKVRANDFRSSGSGDYDYDHSHIDRRAIALAFETARKIGAQSMACDVVFNSEDKPLILEVCYSQTASPANNTGGYWDTSLQFHPGPVWPEDMILEHVLATDLEHLPKLKKNGE
jgi:glutathione synthase/RimK-type ligase-like ATP-grasp enzyme